jgi:hypothetical protein
MLWNEEAAGFFDALASLLLPNLGLNFDGQ